MIKLYYVPNTRATRPRWLLEELGVPYELVLLDPKRGDTQAPAYLAVHPLGKVPALQDGEVTLFESAAVVAYLADRFADKGFAPAPGTAARAAWYQWLFYAATTIEPQVELVAAAARKPDDAAAVEQGDKARAAFAAAAAPLEALLATRPFLLGDSLSAADIVLGSVLAWARSLRLLGDLPALTSYVKSLTARPAWARSRA